MASLLDDDEWLTARQVADILRVDGEALRRWARQGTGPPFALFAPATRRYSRSGLKAWLTDRLQPPSPEGKAS